MNNEEHVDETAGTPFNFSSVRDWVLLIVVLAWLAGAAYFVVPFFVN